MSLTTRELAETISENNGIGGVGVEEAGGCPNLRFGARAAAGGTQRGGHLE